MTNIGRPKSLEYVKEIEKVMKNLNDINSLIIQTYLSNKGILKEPQIDISRSLSYLMKKNGLKPYKLVKELDNKFSEDGWEVSNINRFVLDKTNDKKVQTKFRDEDKERHLAEFFGITVEELRYGNEAYFEAKFNNEDKHLNYETRIGKPLNPNLLLGIDRINMLQSETPVVISLSIEERKTLLNIMKAMIEVQEKT